MKLKDIQVLNEKETRGGFGEGIYEIGKEEGLQYVYIGNTGEEQDTLCPNCRKTLIIREPFGINVLQMLENTYNESQMLCR